MVVVLTALAQSLDKADVEAQVMSSAMAVNDSVEHHAQIGAIIITSEP